MNVGAVNGYCEMLWSVLRQSLFQEGETPGTHIAVVFDHKSKNFRHRLFPAYKANRPPADPELTAQFPLVRKATKAFGIAQLELEGHEADDIIGTIARRMSEVGVLTTIMSSDKDLMQLIGPFVEMWDPLKRRIINSSGVYEKFGVWPTEVADYLAMVGDKVDNVPGLPGVGPKGAADLIHQFGSISAMLQRKQEIAVPRHRKTVVENEPQLILSRQLVDLDLNVPISFDLDAAEVKWPNRLNLVAFFLEMSFVTLRIQITRDIDRQPKEYVHGKKSEQRSCGWQKNPP